MAYPVSGHLCEGDSQQDGNPHGLYVRRRCIMGTRGMEVGVVLSGGGGDAARASPLAWRPAMASWSVVLVGDGGDVMVLVVRARGESGEIGWGLCW